MPGGKGVPTSGGGGSAEGGGGGLEVSGSPPGKAEASQTADQRAAETFQETVIKEGEEKGPEKVLQKLGGEVDSPDEALQLNVDVEGLREAPAQPGQDLLEPNQTGIGDAATEAPGKITGGDQGEPRQNVSLTNSLAERVIGGEDLGNVLASSGWANTPLENKVRERVDELRGLSGQRLQQPEAPGQAEGTSRDAGAPPEPQITPESQETASDAGGGAPPELPPEAPPVAPIPDDQPRSDNGEPDTATRGESTNAEPADGGEPVAEGPPEQSAPGSEETGTSLDGDLRGQIDENIALARAERQRLKELPPDQFNALLETESIAEGQLREMTISPAELPDRQRQELMGVWRDSRRKLSSLQSIANERSAVTTVDSERDQARKYERARAERIADLQTKGVSDLEDLSEKQQSVVRTLEQRFTDERARPPAEQNQNRIKGIEDELREARGEAEEVKSIYDQKSATEKGEEAKSEKDRKEQELKEQLRAAKSPDLLQGDIDNQDDQVGNLEERISNLDTSISEATRDGERENLNGQRDQLVDELVDLRNDQTKNKDALKEAQRREREEFTLKGELNEDTLRQVSRQEYTKMLNENPEEAAKYLKEVMTSMGTVSDAEMDTIADAVLNGDAVGIHERAQFADDFAEQIIEQGGRKGRDMETMQYLHSKYPDIYAYVMEKVTSDQKAVEKIKEAMPSGWQDALKWAKNNPAWLAILLAIIAGGVITAGVAAGPLAGAAATMGAGASMGVGGAEAFGKKK